jgi:hypothetical protein
LLNFTKLFDSMLEFSMLIISSNIVIPLSYAAIFCCIISVYVIELSFPYF